MPAQNNITRQHDPEGPADVPRSGWDENTRNQGNQDHPGKGRRGRSVVRFGKAAEHPPAQQTGNFAASLANSERLAHWERRRWLIPKRWGAKRAGGGLPPTKPSPRFQAETTVEAHEIGKQ